MDAMINLKPMASRVCYPASVQGSIQILMTRIGLGAQLGIKEHPKYVMGNFGQGKSVLGQNMVTGACRPRTWGSEIEICSPHFRNQACRQRRGEHTGLIRED